jgi:hypothetical protein
MRTNLSPQDVTQEVKEAVETYLASRAVAEATRAKVDVVQRQVLQDIILYTDLGRKYGGSVKRIVDPNQVYLSENSGGVLRYLREVDRLLRIDGIKPAEMGFDYCPALVAETDQLQTEWALLDATAKMLEMDIDGRQLNTRLLCEQNGKGLERRQEFIDTVVKMVLAIQNEEVNDE